MYIWLRPGRSPPSSPAMVPVHDHLGLIRLPVELPFFHSRFGMAGGLGLNLSSFAAEVGGRPRASKVVNRKAFQAGDIWRLQKTGLVFFVKAGLHQAIGLLCRVLHFGSIVGRRASRYHVGYVRCFVSYLMLCFSDTILGSKKPGMCKSLGFRFSCSFSVEASGLKA